MINNLRKKLICIFALFVFSAALVFTLRVYPVEITFDGLGYLTTISLVIIVAAVASVVIALKLFSLVMHILFIDPWYWLKNKLLKNSEKKEEEAVLAYIMKDYETSEKLTQQCVNHKQNDKIMLFLAGLIAIKQKNYAQARTYAQDLQNRNALKLFFALSIKCLQTEKSWQELWIILLKAIEKKPSNPWVQETLLNTAMYFAIKNNQFLVPHELIPYEKHFSKKSFKQFKAFLEMYKQQSMPALDRDLVKLKKITNTLDHLPMGNILLSQTLIAMGESADAKKQINNAIERFPDQEVYKTWIDCHAQTSAIERYRIIDKIVKINKHINLKYWQTCFAYDAGLTAEAEKLQKQFQKLYPNTMESNLLAAKALSKQKPEEAITIYSQLIAYRAYSPWQCNRCHEKSLCWSFECTNCSAVNSITLVKNKNSE